MECVLVLVKSLLTALACVIFIPAESMNINFLNLKKNFILLKNEQNILRPISLRAEVPKKDALFCCKRSRGYSHILMNLASCVGDRCINEIKDHAPFSAFTKVESSENDYIPIPFLKNTTEKITYAPHLVYLEKSNEVKKKVKTFKKRKEKSYLKAPMKKLAPAPCFFYLSDRQIQCLQPFALRSSTKNGVNEIELSFNPVAKNPKSQNSVFVKGSEKHMTLKGSAQGFLSQPSGIKI